MSFSSRIDDGGRVRLVIGLSKTVAAMRNGSYVGQLGIRSVGNGIMQN